MAFLQESSLSARVEAWIWDWSRAPGTLDISLDMAVRGFPLIHRPGRSSQLRTRIVRPAGF
jgi:hypothetical protein